jgi:hypothetical protein
VKLPAWTPVSSLVRIMLCPGYEPIVFVQTTALHEGRTGLVHMTETIGASTRVVANACDHALCRRLIHKRLVQLAAKWQPEVLP